MKKLICAVTVLTVSSAQADTIYVDDNAPLGGDGTSWQTAYHFLQDGLTDAAASGGVVTEIRVGQGTYMPDRDEVNQNGPSASNCCAGHDSAGCDDSNCEAIVCAVPGFSFCCSDMWNDACAFWANELCDLPCSRDAAFQLIDSVALRGGYAGHGAPDPDERDPDAYETILSADLLGNDGPCFANHRENTYHVVRAHGISNASLDGLTVSGGYASGFCCSDERGGGVFVEDSNLVISTCTVTKNWAKNVASGLWLNQSTIGIIDCTIAHNQSNPPLGGGGAAVQIVFGSDVTMTRCFLEENRATNMGAVFIGGGDTLTVWNSTFQANTAGRWGGAIFNTGEVTLVNCLLTGNVVLTHDSTSGTGTGGAIMNSSGGEASVVNCTFSLNTVPLQGGALSNRGHIEVSNSILWRNVGGTGNEEEDQITSPSPFLSVNYSAIQGLTTLKGMGNIDADPLFVDPDNGDYRLQAGSPCIDAGDNTAVPEGIDTDLDGNPRFLEIPETPDTGNGMLPIVDMGAYESLGGGCLAVTSQEVICHADGTTFTVNIEGLNACTGGTTQVTFTASGGAVGEELCFTALVSDGGFCCSTEICVTIPDCTPVGKPSDLDGDGIVGMVDFLALLGAWGPCSDCGNCPADFDGDCSVGILDLLILLGNWG